MRRPFLKRLITPGGLALRGPVRHLGSVVACLGIFYSAYIFVQLLLFEASSVPGQQLQPLASRDPQSDDPYGYMLARNAYLQNQLNQSLIDGHASLSCPLDLPILQVLDHSNALYRYIPCTKLIYNRVPKCGSRSLISVFKVLGARYNFSVKDNTKLPTGLNFFRNISNLHTFVRNFTSLEGPLIYTQHLHYVNFTKFGRTPPVYINVIRDPVERLISHYYYNQYGSQSKPLATPKPKFNMSLDECVQQQSPEGSCLHLNQIIPFFCGHDPRCQKRRSTLALQKAKRTVKESYQVVGITEDLNGFFEVLENIFPQFFLNATNVYKEKDRALHELYQTVKKPAVSDKTIAVLKEHLSMEYDFYRFIKSRFYTILTKIRIMHRNIELEEKKLHRREEKFNIWWDTALMDTETE